MSKLRIALIAVLIVVIIGAGAFYLWASDVAAPMPEALAAMQSDQSVTVATSPWLTFTPAGITPTTGLVFYPGAKVDPRAYAPEAKALAAAGYQVVIVPMPLNLAVFGAGKAADVVKAYPAVQRWAIGGHSLGGAMAANYVKSHSDAMPGLALWAAYPGSGDDLSALPTKVTSISGTLDGLATPAKIEASRPLLPASTTWLPIEGGNHAQFGWYGDQKGDNPATITRTEQQKYVIRGTQDLLASLR